MSVLDYVRLMLGSGLIIAGVSIDLLSLIAVVKGSSSIPLLALILYMFSVPIMPSKPAMISGHPAIQYFLVFLLALHLTAHVLVPVCLTIVRKRRSA